MFAACQPPSIECQEESFVNPTVRFTQVARRRTSGSSILSAKGSQPTVALLIQFKWGIRLCNIAFRFIWTSLAWDT